MGSITTGIGLISGIDTANLIAQLLALESRGKIPLQTRVAQLQNQQAAFLDINARLLTFKNFAAAFRRDDIFNSVISTSSDESILTATGSGAQPGTYNFTVKQLVSSSQKLSKGFANLSTAPLGLGSMSFEFGKGKLSTDLDLSELNGGTGVRRGKIVINNTDTTTKTTVDLSTTTTVNEVIEAINNSGAGVTATIVAGDKLKLTHGGGDTFQVENASGDFTATDLGLAGVAAGPTVTGTDIYSLSGATALSALNDRTGAYISNGNPDLKITARDGRIFDIDFGRIDLPITSATLLEDLNDGAGVRFNADSVEEIKFTDKDGDEHLVDLTGITTVAELINRVDSQTNSKIAISIHADGDKFVVTDSTGGSGVLKVEGFGPNGDQTANDLGILNVAGESSSTFNGTALKNADHTPAATTLQDIVDRIASAKDTLGFANGGVITATINSTTNRLVITDTTGGGGNLKVEKTTANQFLARDLGIEQDVAAPVITGTRLLSSMNSVLVRSLNGGGGLNGNLTLRIRDRAGNLETLILNEDDSLADVIDQINAAPSTNVVATLNDSGTGLLLTDTVGGGGNLAVYDTAAGELKIDTTITGVASNTVRGTNVQLRYIAEGTDIGRANFDRGIGAGSFQIIGGGGRSATVNISSSATSINDIIIAINAVAGGASGPQVLAKINDNGDGIVITNTLGSGFTQITGTGGTTAEDLGIETTAKTDGGSIDGSYERVVSLNSSDTLSEVLQAINDAGIPVAATSVNTGSGPNPVRMSFLSEITGKPGDLIIEATDSLGAYFNLGLTTVSEAQNAKVFFGASDPADAVVIERSTNALTDVVSGLTIDLKQASTKSVALTVSRNVPAITGSVSAFVGAFNDVIGRIDELDFFDVDSETRGVLLGDPTTSRIRSSLFSKVLSKSLNLNTRYTRLSEVGVTIGSDNKLTLDTNKFNKAYETDPAAVENLFAAFEAATTSTTVVVEGVTVVDPDTTPTKLGFGEIFNRLLDSLTNTIDGALTIASNTIQTKIDDTNKSIERFDERLAARRLQLERQFTAMERILAGLQTQSSALVSLSGNLAIAQRLQ